MFSARTRRHVSKIYSDGLFATFLTPRGRNPELISWQATEISNSVAAPVIRGLDPDMAEQNVSVKSEKQMLQKNGQSIADVGPNLTSSLGILMNFDETCCSGIYSKKRVGTHFVKRDIVSGLLVFCTTHNVVNMFFTCTNISPNDNRRMELRTIDCRRKLSNSTLMRLLRLELLPCLCVEAIMDVRFKSIAIKNVATPYMEHT